MLIIKKFFSVLTNRERLTFIIVGVILILSSGTRFAIAIQESSEWTPTRGGSFREGVVGQPITVNPIISENQIDHDISRLLYGSLGDITEDYEVKNEGRTYILKLKEELLWSNGQPLTSDDVIFTIETVQDSQTRSPLADNWRGVVAERISELRVSLALPTPYAFFLENLERLPIIPAHIFGSIPPANLKLSAYNLEPIGSGPYEFHDFIKRKDGFIKEYHLKINENYQGEKPFIKDFYFVFYENREALLNDFSLRKIDGVGSLTPLNTEELPGNAVLNQIPMPSYYAIFFNQNLNPILKDEELRHALNIGIDKRKIIEDALKNEASLVNGPLGNYGDAPEVVYKPEEAREIVSSSKEGSIELTLIVPKIDFLEKTASMIREDWLVLGIDKVNVITLDITSILEDVIKTNNYETVLFGNVLENSLDLFPFWHSRERFSPGLNLSLYQNAKVDTLIEKVRQSENVEEQKELAQSAEEIIVSEEPAIFLYSIPYTYVHSPNLNGFGFSEETEENFIVTPSDRFKNITDWHVSKVRTLR